MKKQFQLSAFFLLPFLVFSSHILATCHIYDPILYAKSVDGLIFRKNVIKENEEYKPFHWNQNSFLL